MAAKIEASGFRPDCLIGITTGGLVPLVLLAKKLGVRDIMTVTAISYDGTAQGKLVVSNIPSADLRSKHVLLVDEIADSGRTLREVSHVLHDRCGELRSAVLTVRRDRCTTFPDFSVLDVDRWVVFPWDAATRS
jgi:hypoxanthine phosphoribosyltransferase